MIVKNPENVPNNSSQAHSVRAGLEKPSGRFRF